MKTALAAGLAALLWCSAAAAQNRYPECSHTPSDSDVEAAKGLHKAAEQYYAKARYDRAIQSWNEAYGFDCRAHGLLINIGNAYEKLGETKKAVEAFETYLARTGDSADPTVRDKVANLKELIQRQPQPPSPPSPDPAPVPKPKPRPKPNNGDGTDEGAGPYPWVVVGIGGAIAIAGGVLLGVGIYNLNRADENCDDERTCENREWVTIGNQARVMWPTGAVMLGAGAAAVIGGIVWYVLDRSSAESAAENTLRPNLGVSPQFSGVTLSGRF